MLSSQLENVVRKHHEVHQAIGRLNMPLQIILKSDVISYVYSYQMSFPSAIS